MTIQKATRTSLAAQRITEQQTKVAESKQQSSSGIPNVSLSAVDLPSKFLGYPEGSEISYRPYTFGELLRFSQSKFDKTSRIRFLLEGIFASFPIDDLYYFDFLYIAVLRKLKTFAQSELVVTSICVNCESKQKFNFNLANIDYKDLGVPKLPIILDIDDGEELHFKPLTVGKYLALVRKKQDEDKLAVTAAQVDNKSEVDATKLISGLSGETIADMKEIDNMLFFGMKAVPHTCGECGYENAVNLGGDGIAIEPFRKPEAPARNKIRFGV